MLQGTVPENNTVPEAAAAEPPFSGQDLLTLPPFEKNNPFPLERALTERKTVRSFDPGRTLSLSEISRLLWAPSARALYPVDLLVALPQGVYRYESQPHRLVRVLTEDIRSRIPVQSGFKQAGLIVLYIIDREKVSGADLGWADLEIGCIGQNLFLEATALGLGSGIFAYINTKEVTKLLGLKDNRILRIAQAVGP
ncbi:MAG: nitroreductase family protein [Deltaproteobacteria bacterium]|nr:nitroreductase family protein [Deltaproteobacteria bacterium]